MHRIYVPLAFYSLLLLSSIHSTPIIRGCCSGSTGNQLFSYCFARILAEKLGWTVEFKPVPGFPETYKHPPEVNSAYRTVNLNANWVDVDEYTNMKKGNPTNINLTGFFLHWEYYQPYRDKIRNEWLRQDEPVTPHPNPNDVVVHIRIAPPPWDQSFVTPFVFYEKALESMDFDQVYICIDFPDHELGIEFLKKFEKYSPIVLQHESIQENSAKMRDFRFIMSFNKIIASQSSYSWWAAYLSDATEIIVPKPTDHGLFAPGTPGTHLTDIPEPRFRYIEFERGPNPRR